MLMTSCACVSGSTQDPTLNKIVTGVAIARAPRDINRHELSLYFGCIAHARGKGGSGHVRKLGNGPARVELLRRDGETIYAGSMIATDVCSTDDAPITLLTANAAACKQMTSSLLVLTIGVVIAYIW